LNQIEGVGKKTLESLIAAGFDNIDKVAQAKIEELTKIKGVGKKRAEQIIVKAKEQLKSEK